MNDNSLASILFHKTQSWHIHGAPLRKKRTCCCFPKNVKKLSRICDLEKIILSLYFSLSIVYLNCWRSVMQHLHYLQTNISTESEYDYNYNRVQLNAWHMLLLALRNASRLPLLWFCLPLMSIWRSNQLLIRISFGLHVQNRSVLPTSSKC